LLLLLYFFLGVSCKPPCLLAISWRNAILGLVEPSVCIDKGLERGAATA